MRTTRNQWIQRIRRTSIVILSAVMTPLCGFTRTDTACSGAEAADRAPAQADRSAPGMGPASLPGVVMTCFPQGKDGDAATHDSRSARLMGLYVAQGQPPSSFVPAGPFTAVFQGDVALKLRDSFGFKLEGRGRATLAVNDQVLIKSDDLSTAPESKDVRLNKGANHLVVTYQSPADGDASVRLLWRNRDDLLFEPIAPQSLTHSPTAESLLGDTLRQGRLRMAELRCGQCHRPASSPPGGKSAASQAASGMPELSSDAPDLSDIGSRLNAAWMASWIDNPRSLRPTSHMPRLFHSGASGGAGRSGAAPDPRAADIAAYLATLGAAPPAASTTPSEGSSFDAATIKAGGRLFAEMNCIVCHQPPGGQTSQADLDAARAATPRADDAPLAEPPADALAPRIPLRYVKAKFKPDALTEFLIKPSAHYRWIPMPTFHFSEAEAKALTAFLLTEAAEPASASPAGDASRGKALVASSGCINCHRVGDTPSTLKAAPLADLSEPAWSKGCVAAGGEKRGAAPDVALSESDRLAIGSLARVGWVSLQRDTPAEFAERQIKAMNCVGCHARDGRESLLATTYDAEHRAFEKRYPHAKVEQEGVFAPDQRAPLMTWFGQKLHADWAQSFIAGQVAYKPRPYLYARMPSFEARAAGLAEGMSAQHGYGAGREAASSEPASPESAPVGSQLVGRTPNASFGCVQCHAVNQQPAFAPFEAPAVNFAYTRERVRKDYYDLWTHNPQKLDPTTKMPAFEGADGKTPIATVLEGDGRKQFDAIWHYLQAGQQIVPPKE